MPNMRDDTPFIQVQAKFEKQFRQTTQCFRDYIDKNVAKFAPKQSLTQIKINTTTPNNDASSKVITSFNTNVQLITKMMIMEPRISRLTQALTTTNLWPKV